MNLRTITITALFCTDSLQPVPLLLALIPLGLFALFVRRRVCSWWLLLPPAVPT